MTLPENWLGTCEDRVVAVLSADSGLLAVMASFGTGVIENGSIAPFQDQRLTSNDFPYLGVVAMGGQPNTKLVLGAGENPIEIRLVFAATDADQRVAQRQIQAMLSASVTCVYHQQGSDRFSITSNQARVVNVMSDGNFGFSEFTKREDTPFQIQGEMTFYLLCRVFTPAML